VEAPRELVDAFTEAVPFALREMAGVEAVVRDSRPATGAEGADVSAVVRLAAAGGESRLVLCFPGPTAEALARRVFVGTMAEVSADLVRDCMGEVANVVAGQAKVLLVGTPAHFTLSTPTVEGGPVDVSGGWVIRFESDVGEFGVRIVPGERGAQAPG
jgi:chemotaxis protein CheX